MAVEPLTVLFTSLSLRLFNFNFQFFLILLVLVKVTFCYWKLTIQYFMNLHLDCRLCSTYVQRVQNARNRVDYAL